MRVLRRAALAQDDGRNLMAFPVHPVILSERSESKNPLPFGKFVREGQDPPLRGYCVGEALEPPVTRLTETAAFPGLLLCIFGIDKCPPCVV